MGADSWRGRVRIAASRWFSVSACLAASTMAAGSWRSSEVGGNRWRDPRDGRGAGAHGLVQGDRVKPVRSPNGADQLVGPQRRRVPASRGGDDEQPGSDGSSSACSRVSARNLCRASRTSVTVSAGVATSALADWSASRMSSSGSSDAIRPDGVYGRRVTSGAVSSLSSTKASPARPEVAMTRSSPAPSAGQDRSDRALEPTNRS